MEEDQPQCHSSNVPRLHNSPNASDSIDFIREIDEADDHALGFLNPSFTEQCLPQMPTLPMQNNPGSSEQEIRSLSYTRIARDNKKDGSSSSRCREMEVQDKGKVKVGMKVRTPRFCFQTRSDVDVLDDGYKWRKYGQKVVKNSTHPRSYYRCSHGNCRVKKRVERMSEDCRMVITTYEGRHTHHPCEDQTSPQHDCLDLF